MADSDYVHGEMEIGEQTRTWEGFLTFTVWGSGLLILILAYATFAIALNMNWIVSLFICAAVGIIGGMMMRLGGAWTAAVIGLSGLAVIVQLIIILFGALT